MKLSLLIVLFGLIFGGFGVRPGNTTLPGPVFGKSDSARLDGLVLEYNGGGCFPDQGQLRFNYKDGKWFAKNIDPWFPVGKNRDTIWTIELTNAKLKLVNELLDTAAKYGLHGYLIRGEGSPCYFSLRNDSDYTRIDCNPYISKKFSFDSLEKVLFKEKFDQLAEERNQLKELILQNLSGDWQPKFKQDSKYGFMYQLELIRIKPGSKPSVIWTFGTNGRFSSTGKAEHTLPVSKEYIVKVDGGKEEIYIEAVFGHSKTGRMWVVQNSVEIEILSIEKDRIVAEMRMR